MQYLLILAADALLAGCFAFQKKYQSIAGASIKATLTYNAFVNLGKWIIFAILGLFGVFSVQISVFSVIVATAAAAFYLSYTAIGFKLLRMGNMPLYTMFLMTGGMLVPYVFGLVYLDEIFSVLRFFGIILIVLAVVISNMGAIKPTKKQLFMCCAVFFLNGFMSVTAKIHQADIGAHLNPVNTQSYILIMSAIKVIICFLIVFTMKRKKKREQSNVPFLKVLPVYILSALFDGCSYYLQLIGAKDIPAGVLYPLITAGSIILSAFAGMIVFDEKPSKNQWIAMAVCLAGTCMFI